MQSLKQLKRSLDDHQRMLDAYDGHDNEVRESLRDTIREIKERIEKLSKSGEQADS